MGNRKIIKDLIEKYLNRGGSLSFIDSLPEGYSVQKEAKLREAIRGLQEKGSKLEVTSNGSQVEDEQNFDLISEYPPQLHSAYLSRKHYFLLACSLKMRLNNVAENEEQSAFVLQKKIWDCFKIVDDASYKLAYWRAYKRILTDEVCEDFSKLTETELVQRRNTLRSNASNRARTILKMESQLGNTSNSKLLKLQDKIIKKKEELRQIHLQITKLSNMIENIENASGG